MKGQGRSPKVRRSSQQQNPQEREEIKEYLARLRQIVPGCPKDGKLSRLELIQHVIDYIVQLQDTLLRHPINRLLGTEEDPTISPVPLPATPPMSPLPYVTNTHSTQNLDTSNLQSQPTFVTSNRSNKRNNNSCRRPLGVLSSLNQHRSV
ncbi:UNVERIFIED_CONTAM: hypothetical protein RMT77_000301 [Armadillidium vulgare]